jgi:hypothetical protein
MVSVFAYGAVDHGFIGGVMVSHDLPHRRRPR